MSVYQEVQDSGISWPSSLDMLYGSEPQMPAREKSRSNAILFQDLEIQLATFSVEQETLLERVRKLFVIPAGSSVTTFLTEHRTIAQTLLEADAHLRECFGTDTIFNLRTTVDEARSRTLCATVIWPGSVGDARAALARFDNWWLAQPRPGAGYLYFTYELI